MSTVARIRKASQAVSETTDAIRRLSGTTAAEPFTDVLYAALRIDESEAKRLCVRLTHAREDLRDARLAYDMDHVY